jgi:cardiolipin synthase
VADPPLTFRRLVGLDRSGGPPPQTRRGEPLNPWTIPNAIGFARLALVPLFLAIGLSSGDGHSGVAFALFAFIAWSDYFDGMAARITGQYSRLGALLDPFTDRLLIVSGALVAWHYETLPRWALALLTDGWFLDALLIAGLAMTLAATVRYVQDGVRAAREASTST